VITKGVKVLYFHNLLQVFIPNGLDVFLLTSELRRGVPVNQTKSTGNHQRSGCDSAQKESQGSDPSALRYRFAARFAMLAYISGKTAEVRTQLSTRIRNSIAYRIVERNLPSGVLLEFSGKGCCFVRVSARQVD
jgi:hypothetical protein